MQNGSPPDSVYSSRPAEKRPAKDPDSPAKEHEALARGAAPPECDMELLEQAGIAERLPEWHKIAESAHISQRQLVG